MPENNAQQTAAPRGFCLVRRRPLSAPSHYGFVVITGIMASSPLFQPVREVRSVILARLGGDAQIRTQEGRTQFGHQFLAGVSVIAKAFAPELPVESALVLGPVGLMPTSA